MQEAKLKYLLCHLIDKAIRFTTDQQLVFGKDVFEWSFDIDYFEMHRDKADFPVNESYG